MAELTSMVDFVLEQIKEKTGLKKIGGVANALHIIHNYAKFLKQSLEIWMFVPCKLVDGNWVVLEEPDADYYMMVTEHDLKEYQQAKSLCLFEGFEYKNGKVKCLNDFTGVDFNDFKTIEDLIDFYDITLTPAAEKQIGL